MSVVPFTVDGDFSIYVGDAAVVLAGLPTASVDCVVTSPPYFHMRDYKMKGQIGWEKTPQEFAERLAEAFSDLKRVLKPSGSMWLNIGDKYVRKQLVGVPTLVRDALRADGWFWRAEIIWHKTNVSPQSAKDRVTHAHEFLYHFTLGPSYYYDAKAIEEPAEWSRWGKQTVPKYEGTKTSSGWMQPKSKAELSARTTRNKRSVWSIPTSNYPGAHDAVFPEKLVEPCVLATCPPGGVVLDPCIGSGTTAIVALKHGRRAIGIELSKKAARQAVVRVGKEARV